jgi:hypothetical protein
MSRMAIDDTLLMVCLEQILMLAKMSLDDKAPRGNLLISHHHLLFTAPLLPRPLIMTIMIGF